MRVNAVNTDMTEVATPRKHILGARSRRSPKRGLKAAQIELGASDASVYISAIVAATIAERICMVMIHDTLSYSAIV